MSWRSESPFTVGFRAYVGFWFHCSPNPSDPQKHSRLSQTRKGLVYSCPASQMQELFRRQDSTFR
ncbi:TPA: hypothetical protein L6A81_35185 [Pseudomonas aeruginosa]|nr:hypothetical protein [Pseudomonas aeruginosa]